MKWNSALALTSRENAPIIRCDTIQRYLNSVSRQADLRDDWYRHAGQIKAPPLPEIYSEICELERIAADSLIAAHASSAMSSEEIEQFLFGLSKPVHEIPLPFQVCCLRHVDAEINLLLEHGCTKIVFIGGGSFPTTGINAALRGLDVTLVDCDPQANIRAHKLALTLSRELQSRLHFVTANATTLQIREHNFDAAFLAAMVTPKDKVLSHLAGQLRESSIREPLILSRSARSAISCGLFEEDPSMLVYSPAHITTICSSRLCDTRCRIYSASKIALP